MRRQIIVSWEENPVATRVVGGSRLLRVGPDAHADVTLPVAAIIDGDGDTVVGAFIVHVSTLHADDTIRAPWRVGRIAWSVALSAFLHASVLFGVAILASLPTMSANDDASHLGMMKGYLARISDHETKHEQIPHEPSPWMIAPEPVTPASPVDVTARAAAHKVDDIGGTRATSGGGASRQGSVRVGDWVGTYTCLDRIYGLALRIDNVRGNEFHVVGSATSPDGIQASYAQHGVRDPSTGVSRFLPDGWVGEPMPAHDLSGMHGHFSGDTFSGVIDNPLCGNVNLRRHV